MSVSSVVALVFVLAYKGFSCDGPWQAGDNSTHAHGASHANISGTGGASGAAAQLGSLAGILRSLPVFVCIYICSFSALPLDIELRKPSRRRMTTMVVGAFAIAFMLYMIAGLSGLAYGSCTAQAVPSNVLAMFKRGDGLASLLRVLLSVVLLLSLPLICLPCRSMIQQLLVIWRRDASCLAPFRLALANISPVLGQRLLPSPDMGSRFGQGFEHSDYESEGEDEVAAGGRGPNGGPANGNGGPMRLGVANGNGNGNGNGIRVSTVPISRRRNSSVGQVFESLVQEEAGEMPLGTRVVLSSCIMSAALLGTANVDDVSVVWGFLGSTCGILLSYVLPAASYLLLRRTPQSAKKRSSNGDAPAKASSVPRRKLAALLLVVIGLALIPTCLYNTARAVWSTQP
jgi:amino acid permease